ncbi:MAG: PQQ-like beta-propeller repeat protein [Asgard group archaeon]|nr:PQQ-like beta-propeller repeat protein [Asgard group archaeon]
MHSINITSSQNISIQVDDEPSELWSVSLNSADFPIIADLDRDGEFEVIISSYSREDSHTRIYCIDSNGKIKWAYKCQGTYGRLSIADINEDGKLDVVFGTNGGRNFVICINHKGKLIWKTACDGWVHQWYPCIIDLNKDGHKEIIVNNEHGNPFFLNHKGRKKSFFNSDFETPYAPVGSPIAFDIDGDGEIELLMKAFDGNFYCFSKNGDVKWSYVLEDYYYSCTPSVINIDDDGTLAILITKLRKLICLNYDGTHRWNASIEDGGIWLAPTICDINNDGDPEILAYGSWSSYSHLGDTLYCLDMNGNQLWNYTGVQLFPMIADIDGDSENEIVIGKSRKFVTINSTGDSEDLLVCNRNNYAASSCLGDLNNDGSLELITVSYISPEVTCYTIPSSSNKASGNWWTFQGSYQHLGYPDTDGDLVDDVSEDLFYNTNYAVSDTDNDNMIDGWEIEYGLDPLKDDSQLDFDKDGYTNIEEYNKALNPTKWDNRIKLYVLYLLPLWVGILAAMTYSYIKLRPLTPKIIKLLQSIETTIRFQIRYVFLGKPYTKDELAYEHATKMRIKEERKKLKEDTIRDRMI